VKAAYPLALITQTYHLFSLRVDHDERAAFSVRIRKSHDNTA